MFSAKKLCHFEKAFGNLHFGLELLSIWNLPLRGGFEMVQVTSSKAHVSHTLLLGCCAFHNTCHMIHKYRCAWKWMIYSFKHIQAFNFCKQNPPAEGYHLVRVHSKREDAVTTLYIANYSLEEIMKRGVFEKESNFLWYYAVSFWYCLKASWPLALPGSTAGCSSILQTTNCTQWMGDLHCQPQRSVSEK